eukprot:9093054-Pyramimonas_sp.AAC.1
MARRCFSARRFAAHSCALPTCDEAPSKRFATASADSAGPANEHLCSASGVHLFQPPAPSWRSRATPGATMQSSARTASRSLWFAI